MLGKMLIHIQPNIQSVHSVKHTALGLWMGEKLLVVAIKIFLPASVKSRDVIRSSFFILEGTYLILLSDSFS